MDRGKVQGQDMNQKSFSVVWASMNKDLNKLGTWQGINLRHFTREENQQDLWPVSNLYHATHHTPVYENDHHTFSLNSPKNKPILLITISSASSTMPGIWTLNVSWAKYSKTTLIFPPTPTSNNSPEAKMIFKSSHPTSLPTYCLICPASFICAMCPRHLFLPFDWQQVHNFSPKIPGTISVLQFRAFQI